MSNLYIKLVCSALTDARLMEAGPDAFTMWVRGLLYAKEHLTDGSIPRAVLSLIGTGVRHPQVAIERLVALGLWQENAEGWTVGGEKWARYQTTRDAVEAKREQNRERQAKHRSKNTCHAPHDGGCNAHVTRDIITDVTQKSRNQTTENREQTTENREQTTENREQEALEALDNSADNGPAKSAGQRAREIKEPSSSPEATALATRFIEARSRNNGPKPTAASVATFASRVFDSLLDEHGPAETEQVLAYLEKPGCRWWQFVSNNPKGHEHSLKRNFSPILMEARNGGRKDPNAAPPRVDPALADWLEDEK